MKLILLISLSLISLIRADDVVLCDDERGECMNEDQCKTGINPRTDVTATNCIAPQICCSKEYRCGTRNLPSINERSLIEIAEFGEFPWQVAVLKTQAYGVPKYIGGGSLIHKSFVLTLATKFANEAAADLTARIGEFDFTSTSESFQHLDIKIRKIIIHEHFEHANARPNNIALLQLEKAVELDYHINLICLPPPNVKFDNKTCVATSWGKSRLTEPEEKFPSILKKSEMPVHEKAVCDEAYSNTNPPIKGLIPGVICAGGGERDTCEGHGGSPLACVGDNGAIFQIGIAAWGLGCKKPEAPIAYTEVSHYVDWINENTGF